MSIVATPVPALLGGISLGLLSVGRLLIHGRILGISGHVRSVVKGVTDASKAAHLVGLAAGGTALAVLAPGCFGVLPKSFSLGRAAVAGVLVGSGASLGSGCTSGHGICGNARLSPRSLLFTAIIMATGAVTARLTGTAQALGVPEGAPTLGLPSRNELLLGVSLISTTAAVLGWTAARARQSADQKADGASPGLLADAAQGALFALSLGLAGMTNPGKVAGFLNVTRAGFDYSLMCVMGGAVAVAMPVFWRVFRSKKEEFKSLTGSPAPDVKSSVDGKLILGAVLFGAGWGLGGLCPGPAVAGLATMSKQLLVFNAAMVAAMSAIP